MFYLQFDAQRTTATTLASVQAAAKDLSRPTSQEDKVVSDDRSRDLGTVFLSAMKAAQRAGRLVDNLELMEKSEELEKQ
jgi:hypothetical protein